VRPEAEVRKNSVCVSNRAKKRDQLLSYKAKAPAAIGAGLPRPQQDKRKGSVRRYLALGPPKRREYGWSSLGTPLIYTFPRNRPEPRRTRLMLRVHGPRLASALSTETRMIAPLPLFERLSPFKPWTSTSPSGRSRREASTPMHEIEGALHSRRDPLGLSALAGSGCLAATAGEGGDILPGPRGVGRKAGDVEPAAAFREDGVEVGAVELPGGVGFGCRITE
jgi:hypothetical protein